ncbi:hypothetical protein ABZ354_10870 [Streptomyces sp. NPDC005925]|uniref:hypothetical protein n=1 Tax=Streptomyces sp. NPDC005925 TaxID=3157172 RepID=UPI0033DAD684
MDDPETQEAARPVPVGTGGHSVPAAQAGVIGIGLAAVLTFALAEGAWEWFASYIGLTLLAVISFVSRMPPWKPGLRSAYVRVLIAYSMVAGLCVAIVLAPVLQRSAWLFPMPGTRDDCRAVGRYESLRTEAALGNLTGRDSAALAQARAIRRHDAVADCLASTTTRWLPLYGLGASVLVGLGAWAIDRALARREAGATV